MILALEIWFTIAAWRNGWGPVALIPVGLCLLLGTAIGASLPNGVDGGALALLFIPDLVALGTLIGMSRKAPAWVEQVTATEVAPAEISVQRTAVE